MDHEALHIAMYGRVVIIPASTEGEKVVRRFFNLVAFQLDLDISQVRMQRHRHRVGLWEADPLRAKIPPLLADPRRSVRKLFDNDDRTGPAQGSAARPNKTEKK